MSGANGEGVAGTLPRDRDSGLQLHDQRPEVVKPHAGRHRGLTPVLCSRPNHDRDWYLAQEQRAEGAQGPLRLGPGGHRSHPNALKALELTLQFSMGP